MTWRRRILRIPSKAGPHGITTRITSTIQGGAAAPWSARRAINSIGVHFDRTLSMAIRSGEGLPASGSGRNLSQTKSAFDCPGMACNYRVLVKKALPCVKNIPARQSTQTKFPWKSGHRAAHEALQMQISSQFNYCKFGGLHVEWKEGRCEAKRKAKISLVLLRPELWS